MVKQIKARYSRGKIEPLEDVDLKEGEEVIITIEAEPSADAKHAFRRSAGGWRGVVDTDALLSDIQAGRKRQSPPVDLGL